VHLLTKKVGKTLAYTNIKFTNPAGDIVARGSHTKYVYTVLMRGMVEALTSNRFVALAWKDPQNIVEQLKEQNEQNP